MADLILKPSSGSGNKVRIQDQTGSDNLIIDADASMTGVKPHIIPGMLYPSYVASGTSNKLLDGSTSHSGNFGTEQSDGRKYYYTNIAGSKPIKDPRIGAHFGSQRHTFRSAQLLEQETANHGENVWSVDGREWIRIAGNAWETTGSGKPVNNSNAGVRIDFYNNTTAFIEIVGYFNDANLKIYADTNSDQWNTNINGGTVQAQDASINVSTPLGSRFVDAHSLVNLAFNSAPTLGINTLKISVSTATYFYVNAIELIAQDTQDFTATNATNILTTTGHTLTNGDQIRLTGSDLPNGLNATTTYYVISVSGNNFQVSTSSGGSAVTFSDDGSGSRTWTALNNIQIPAQTVVSYGKKFSIDAQSTHYDPFNGFTNDTTLFSARVDVATSLGLGTATTWGAPWDKGSSNHIRPYNGGRVVKWVDASGNIKTSVTMMPANAQNRVATASNEITTASATNTTTTPNMSDDAIDHSLSEVAKTFHIREFGNGAANGGAGGTYADASMLAATGTDNLAFCMDDGLTSHSGQDIERQIPTASCHFLSASGNDDGHFFTFIGTGVSTIGRLSNTPTVQTWAQNLPYGTHILQIQGVTDVEETKVTLDGVVLNSSKTYMQYAGVQEIIFHQPKKPPIPEEACIISDYMLFADLVVNTTAGFTTISKGVRAQSPTRDVVWTGTGAGTWAAYYADFNMFIMGAIVDGANITSDTGPKLTYFGSPEMVSRVFQNATSVTGYHVTFDGTAANASSTNSLGATFSGGSFPSISSSAPSPTQGNIMHSTLNTSTMGTHTYHIKGDYTDSTDDYISHDIFEVVTPIHTSSHYQSFETPFLHELVGGDRNMEQHNLIVTPDGKTWDELRDTSYIGPEMHNPNSDTGRTDASPHIFDEHRGTSEGIYNYHSKNFAVAWDRQICLVDGMYHINTFTHRNGGTDHSCRIYVNDVQIAWGHHGTSNHDSATIFATLQLKRGDYVEIRGYRMATTEGSKLEITRLK